MEHSYHFSYAHKNESVACADVPEDLKQWYRWAVQCKIAQEPPRFDREDLLAWWHELAGRFQDWHQYFEQRRWQTPWQGWDHYALAQLRMGLHRPATYLRLLSLNVRTLACPGDSIYYYCGHIS